MQIIMIRRTNLLGAAIAAALVLLINPVAGAETTPANDLTPQFLNGGIHVDGLRAVEVGGIVVLRGQTDDASNAIAAAELAGKLGYNRVANLIRIVDVPDDARIERTAERQLAMHRALDGCTFHVDSDRGVLTVAGRVKYELQKDVAMDVLRNIDGVRLVRASLQR